MTELMAQLVGTWLQTLGWKVLIGTNQGIGGLPDGSFYVAVTGEIEEGKARICK